MLVSLVTYPAPLVIALLFKEIFPVPSNETPAIVLADAKAVAVAASPEQLPELPDVLPVTLPVTLPCILPTKVPVNLLFVESKVRPVPVFGSKSPAAAVTNNREQDESEESAATTTCDAAPPLDMSAQV